MPIAATHPFLASLEHLLGFFLVLLALTLLWGLTEIVGIWFKRSTRTQPSAVANASEPAEASSPSGSDDPTEEEVVVIAAAVSTLIGQRSRIVSIRSSTKDWHREGRREHFASHKIR